MTKLTRVISINVAPAPLDTVEAVNARYEHARAEMATLDCIRTDMLAMELNAQAAGREVPLSYFEAYARLSELAIMVARLLR